MAVDWSKAPKGAEFYGQGLFWTFNDSDYKYWCSFKSRWFSREHWHHPKKSKDYEPRPTAQEWPEDDARINNIGLNRTEDDMGHYDELREAQAAPAPLANKYDRKITGKYGTGSCTVDVYRVLDAFKTDSAAIDHAIKKLLCAGMRGAKDKRQDYLEAIQSIEAALKLAEDKKL